MNEMRKKNDGNNIEMQQKCALFNQERHIE